MIYLPVGLKITLCTTKTGKNKSGVISYFKADDFRSEMTMKDSDENEEEYSIRCISGSAIVFPKKRDTEATMKHAFQEGLAHIPFSCEIWPFHDEDLFFLDFPTVEEKPDCQEIADWFDIDKEFSVFVEDFGGSLVAVSYSDLYRLTL